MSDAVAAVMVKVALLLDDRPGLAVAEGADGQMVGQGAGGHEDRSFLPQQLGKAGLKLCDVPSQRVGIALKAGLSFGLNQLAQHRLGTLGFAIAPEDYGGIGFLAGNRAGCNRLILMIEATG